MPSTSAPTPAAFIVQSLSIASAPNSLPYQHSRIPESSYDDTEAVLLIRQSLKCLLGTTRPVKLLRNQRAQKTAETMVGYNRVMEDLAERSGLSWVLQAYQYCAHYIGHPGPRSPPELSSSLMAKIPATLNGRDTRRKQWISATLDTACRVALSASIARVLRLR